MGCLCPTEKWPETHGKDTLSVTSSYPIDCQHRREPAAHSNFTREFASLSLNLHIYICIYVDMQIIRMSVSSVQTQQNLEKLESSWRILAHVGFTSCWTNSRNLQRWNMEEESSFLVYMVVCKLCVDKLFLLSLVRIPHIISQVWHHFSWSRWLVILAGIPDQGQLALVGLDLVPIAIASEMLLLSSRVTALHQKWAAW
jgi:hypothetical protein